MATAKKILSGIGKTFTQANTIEKSGGLSSLLIRRRANMAGGLTIAGAVGGVSLINEGFKGRNQAKLGRVSYGDGMARMTSSFTSGVVPAMHSASGGNYGAFADMAEEVVTARGLGRINDYGASPALISALYNMGGR